MVAQPRGSLELVRQRCENSELEEKDIALFLQAIEMSGIKLEDCFCRGIPRPDIISGTLSVNREVFDKLSNRLLDLETLRVSRWEVFPYGIPVIDNLRVELDLIRGF